MFRAPLLAALPAFVVLSASAQPPTVGVFLDFDTIPSKAPVEVMKKEVEALLKNSGVTLDWRMAAGHRSDETFDGLVVLKFQGSCKAEPVDAAPGQTRPLATTRVENGRVLPFSQVQCDEVRQALSYLRPEANQGERQKALGLALGRVVAHELYHALAKTTAHAARGLAKAVESLDDLVSASETPFRPEDAAAIRKGVVR